MLVNEQNVVLKACIEVSLEAQFANDWIVVAVDVGVNTIHSLEDLPDHAGKRFGKGNAWDGY